MTKTPDTPVVSLLRLVWEQANSKTGFSWERLNHSMHSALTLCIGAGFPFCSKDFAAVYEVFRGSRWMGDMEWVYTFAICEGNPSAAVAFEEWRGRGPLIGDEVMPAPIRGGFAHLTGERQRERLHVGCSFLFQGKRRKVTSFSNDEKSLTACTYHKPKDGEHEGKIKTRSKVTRDMILADRAERKEREVAHQEFMNLVDGGKTTMSEVRALLGVANNDQYQALPIEKIRKVLASLAEGGNPS